MLFLWVFYLKKFDYYFSFLLNFYTWHWGFFFHYTTCSLNYFKDIDNKNHLLWSYMILNNDVLINTTVNLFKQHKRFLLRYSTIIKMLYFMRFSISFRFFYLNKSEILPFFFLFLNSASWDVKHDDDKRAHLYYHLYSSHVKEKKGGKGKGFIFFEPHRVCICVHTLARALSYTRDNDEIANRVYIPPSPSFSLLPSNAWLNMNWSISFCLSLSPSPNDDNVYK